MAVIRMLTLSLTLAYASLCMLESFSVMFFPCIRKDEFWQPQVYTFMTCNPKGRETICLPYPYIEFIQISTLMKLLGSHVSPLYNSHWSRRRSTYEWASLGHGVPTLVAKVVGHLDKCINNTWRLAGGSQGRASRKTKAICSRRRVAWPRPDLDISLFPSSWYLLSTPTSSC